MFLVKFRGKILGGPFELNLNLNIKFLTKENLDFGRGHGLNFDHLTIVKC